MSVPGPRPPSNIHRLPPSPSPSVSDDDGQDHDSADDTRPRILGVREIAELRRLQKKRAPKHQEIVLIGDPDHTPVDEPIKSIPLFAQDVNIKGWKIVGGKGWSDKAKMGAYVVYDIDITLRSGGTINILRRYTDFVDLRRDLQKAFPHLRGTIPHLPGKKHMSKFSTEFLEDRQPRLQRFLRTIMLHPEMGVGGANSVLSNWITHRAGP